MQTEKSNYTIKAMKECCEQGYRCDFCESFDGCESAKWYCDCCGKHTTYKNAVKRIFFQK